MCSQATSRRPAPRRVAVQHGRPAADRGRPQLMAPRDQGQPLRPEPRRLQDGPRRRSHQLASSRPAPRAALAARSTGRPRAERGALGLLLARGGVRRPRAPAGPSLLPHRGARHACGRLGREQKFRKFGAALRYRKPRAT